MSARVLDLVRDSELAAHLVSLERLTEDRGRRATGLAALDRLLGGGWPRAALSEISGRRSSGRTTVMRAALAAAIAAGETVALVDAGGSLDARAWTELGLLWVRCAPPQALKAADLVVAAGGFGMVALDLCDATLRIPDAAWVRLRHTARAQGTTVLIAGGARRLGAFAAAAIDLGGAPAFDADGPPLFTGVAVRALRLRDGRSMRLQAENDQTGTLGGFPDPPATTPLGGAQLRQRENGQPCASLVFTSRS